MEHGARLNVPPRALRVTTAAEAAARDRRAIDAGTPSFDLMLQAGTAAASWLLRECAELLAHGVALHAGSGNNGGDAYIVAAQLARAGVTVRLHASLPPRTPDARQAAQLAQPYLVHGAPTGRERLVVDGLLGTGHHGPLRDILAADCARLGVARDGGATLVALDLPSGLDATTGEVAEGSVPAHVTLSFGTFKRGTLLRREHVGRLVLLDTAGERETGDAIEAAGLELGRASSAAADLRLLCRPCTDAAGAWPEVAGPSLRVPGTLHSDGGPAAMPTVPGLRARGGRGLEVI
jgi:NAD(P)H-hydrate epimerase